MNLTVSEKPDDIDFEAESIAVTVIVGVYNHEEFIAQALDSVLSQATDFNVEILVTEDCSTDSTMNVLDKYQGSGKFRVEIINSESNLNSPEVFVRAIKKARGKYIAYLDGDDYWTSKDKLQRQFEFMELNPDCALVHHAVERVTKEGEPIRVIEGFPSRATIVDLIQGNPIASCSAMIRRSSVDPLPDWFGLVKAGDWAIYVIAAQHGWIGKIDGVLGHYRIHSSAGWATAPLAMQWAESLSMLDVMENHLSADYHAAFARSRSSMISKIKEEISLQAAMSVDRELLHEQRRLDEQTVAEDGRDPATIAERAARVYAERAIRLYEELSEARSQLIKAKDELVQSSDRLMNLELSFGQERQQMLLSSEHLLGLLRKERRFSRRASVTVAVVFVVLAAAWMASTWLR